MEITKECEEILRLFKKKEKVWWHHIIRDIDIPTYKIVEAFITLFEADLIQARVVGIEKTYDSNAYTDGITHSHEYSLTEKGKAT
ncbi:hypothetical protein F4Z99_04100 [Candidatus Poribacteria bacterium]|nr:hypothetical protein [Candidatus Poribacteria bacterium]